ncbi:MAG: hypothetical protein R3D58_13020 [Saprospiraceae bacterium]
MIKQVKNRSTLPKLCVEKAAGFQEFRRWTLLKQRISKRKSSHFKADGRISLRILDQQHRFQKLEPIVPCEWMNHGTTWLAICRNPYPTQSDNRWLLCYPNGTACFAGPTAETARIFFYTKTNGLQVGKSK